MLYRKKEKFVKELETQNEKLKRKMLLQCEILKEEVKKFRKCIIDLNKDHNNKDVQEKLNLLIKESESLKLEEIKISADD